MVQARGIWLPRADGASRPLQADLHGLTRPLRRRRRASITWETLWRQYGETAHEHNPGNVGKVDSEILSTDTRVRVGVGFGATDRLQIATDGTGSHRPS